MKEHAIAFALWLKDLDLMFFAKYHDDEDGGEAAIREAYDDFVTESPEHMTRPVVGRIDRRKPAIDEQATDYDYGYGDLD